VTGVEFDAGLAARARELLAPWPQVTAMQGDASRMAPGPADAIFVNAGATRPLALWLDALAPGGRLIFPLTLDVPGREAGFGAMLRVTRTGHEYAVAYVSPVGVFHCSGARDAESERALRESFAAGGLDRVTRLRRDPHPPGAACWHHGAGVCLSS
jgi:protein-L-isoaspartate(D-aspartate) O-methyltransferase